MHRLRLYLTFCSRLVCRLSVCRNIRVVGFLDSPLWLDVLPYHLNPIPSLQMYTSKNQFMIGQGDEVVSQTEHLSRKLLENLNDQPSEPSLPPSRRYKRPFEGFAAATKSFFSYANVQRLGRTTIVHSFALGWVYANQHPGNTH